MQYFYVHHYMDSFSVMGQLLGEYFSFARRNRYKVGLCLFTQLVLFYVVCQLLSSEIFFG